MKLLTEVYIFTTECSNDIEQIAASIFGVSIPLPTEPEEGFCMIRLDGSLFVMVETTLEGAKKMVPFAKRIANKTNKPIRLLHFTKATCVQVINPGREQ